eukprot:TRINITY_DN72927_c0_g1_i1.p2 TRINITY_DN72927_c0_g1~~TRINITY_DN72927_c0_g1_i1.p2  ORF type:complete len:151 (+),score=62.57 TRINITY_DN72927_c0_g1_i1:56-508(+)
MQMAQFLLLGLVCGVSATVTKTVIATSDAPGAIGPYSQAIKVASNGAEMVYVSGQIGLFPNGTMVAGGIQAETQQAMTNIRNILTAAGSSTDDIVECTCLLADLGEYDAFNTIYAKFFSSAPPSRAAFQVVALPKSARTEIKCTAAVQHA